MAGFTTTLRLLAPIVISALGTCSVLLMRAAVRDGGSLAGAAVRGAIGSLLIAGLVAYWTKVRDRMRIKIRAFMDEGRAQTSAKHARSGT
jgi:hypothetical protein